VRYCVHLS